MDAARPATVCIVTTADSFATFQRCLAGVLAHTPRERIELRLGFIRATRALYHAIGILCPDGTAPERHQLPGGVERFHWTARAALAVHAWVSPLDISRQRMLRFLCYDAPLETEYAVWLGAGARVEAGRWEALLPLMEQQIDYLGVERWHEYSRPQLEMIQAQSWFMGVPIERREGRLGVSYMAGGFLAVRSDRLREAKFPECRDAHASLGPEGADVLLGEIARQHGWTSAEYSQKAAEAQENRHEAVTEKT